MAIAEIDVLWITAGLGCDGETIALTGASQPSLEDPVLGGIPWVPKVNFTIPSWPRKPATTSWNRFTARLTAG
jgi:hypothetical protein